MTTSPFHRAVAVVTGASSGIGAATAVRLAASGAQLYLCGRHPQRLAQLAGQLDATPLYGDLADPTVAARLAEQVMNATGRVDLLINNAGLGWSGPLATIGDDEIQRLVTVNLTAPMLLTRAVLPGMLARGRGHLGFVGSIAGRLAVREEAVYSATKAGLTVFADSLRQEVAGTGVVVTELVPAVVDTAFFDRRGRAWPRSAPPPVSAQQAADALLAAMLRGQPEAYLPRWLRLPVAVRATLPAAYRRLAARFG